MAIVGRTIITITKCPCSFNDKTGPWYGSVSGLIPDEGTRLFFVEYFSSYNCDYY